MLNSILSPPLVVRGMKILDKTLFNKVINVPSINITGIKPSEVLPQLKQVLLKLRHFKPVQTNDDEMHVLLNPVLINEWNNLDENVRSVLENKSITKDRFTVKKYSIGYDNWGSEDILKMVLPVDQDGVASFTQIGHVVHINLREHLWDYKHLIGQVLLDKVSNCRTVVNKVQNIDNVYRNFQMEVLAGDNDMMVKLKENLCTFEFDLSTVYWNSRLSREHERIIEQLRADDVLFDVFAGIGPFSIPAAKKKCIVYANDLNPDSFKWLNHCIKLNKINANSIQTFMRDGRDFIKTVLRDNLLKHLIDNKNVHVTMNLPAVAVEFLNEFIGLYAENEFPCDVTNCPIVHVYCFTKTMEDPVDVAKNLVEQHLKHSLGDKLIDIFKVRTVSNYKDMMRVSFKLTGELVRQNNKKRKQCEELD